MLCMNRSHKLVIGRNSHAAFGERAFDNEILQGELGENFFDAGSLLFKSFKRSIRILRLPIITRTVSAFGQPYSARSLTKMFFVGCYCKLNLSADISVVEQKRKISMRCAAGHGIENALIR